MARQPKGGDGLDIFGFEELEKTFNRMSDKYEDKVDALLMAQGRTATKRVKSKTPVGKTKKLKGSWRLKKVKRYGANGAVRVVRIQTEAPHGHLVEDGHEIIRGGKTRQGGRTLNTVQRAARGIKSGGRVEGKEMLKSTMKDLQSGFFSAAEKLLDDITKEAEL